MSIIMVVGFTVYALTSLFSLLGYKRTETVVKDLRRELVNENSVYKPKDHNFRMAFDFLAYGNDLVNSPEYVSVHLAQQTQTFTYNSTTGQNDETWVEKHIPFSKCDPEKFFPEDIETAKRLDI